MTRAIAVATRMEDAGPHPAEVDREIRVACRSSAVDPEVFFPLSQRADDVDPALTRCAACPIREACARWALPIVDLYGTWGGLTQWERIARRKELGIRGWHTGGRTGRGRAR